MDGHRVQMVGAVDRQFGPGVGEKLFPRNKTIVLNKVSAIDAMFEVVVDGHIVGRLRFDIPRLCYNFLLSLEGARRVARFSRKSWVRCHEDVIPYLKNGGSLLVPGVSDCDPAIEPGDEVYILGPQDEVLGTGIARMSGRSMQNERRGVAVKVRLSAESQPPSINDRSSSWADAVEANRADLEMIEAEAIQFIRSTVERHSLPVVVGFSGGKDSLVTYLLVEKALGRSPPMFFMDTGLELPETVEYVRSIAREHGVEIIGEKAGGRFWRSLDSFGPPARDFRWCCKVLKLGPAATAIAEKMGGRTLAFLGQRRLESFQRSMEPRVTSNPWVPGQTSANPIQNWNALEVWLYIFREGVSFNPLYERGYHRMGCYLCPASSMAELESLKVTHPGLYARWHNFLLDWAEKQGLPREWATLGFWRWKHLPPAQRELAERLGLSLRPVRDAPTEMLSLRIVKGVSPCVSAGFSVEGQFSSSVDIERVRRLLPIFGRLSVSESLGGVRIATDKTSIVLFSSGSLTIRGPDEQTVRKLVTPVERAVRRALFCQGCGSCVPQCPHNALYLGPDGKIAVDSKRCTHCLQCDTFPCPTYLQ